jgi:hypothetical protein
MIRCIRLWSGSDDKSHFEEGVIDLEPGPRGDTLSGTLKFTTHDGRFSLRVGDILFTEDTTGAGHDWTLLGDQPWRRLYAILDQDTVVPFRPAESHPTQAQQP